MLPATALCAQGVKVEAWHSQSITMSWLEVVQLQQAKEKEGIPPSQDHPFTPALLCR